MVDVTISIICDIFDVSNSNLRNRKFVVSYQYDYFGLFFFSSFLLSLFPFSANESNRFSSAGTGVFGVALFVMNADLFLGTV